MIQLRVDEETVQGLREHIGKGLGLSDTQTVALGLRAALIAFREKRIDMSILNRPTEPRKKNS